MQDAPLNTHSPEFLRISPQGAIPVVEDDRVIEFKTLACTLHLARKHDGTTGQLDATKIALRRLLRLLLHKIWS